MENENANANVNANANTNTDSKPVGILSAKAAKTVEKLKKNFLRIGVYVLIGGIVTGALLIMFGNSDSGGYIAKTMGMLIVFAIMMLVSANNFKTLESGKKEVQVFALIGLVMNIVWAIMWILAIWSVYDVFGTCSSGYGNSYVYATCNNGLTVLGKIAMMSTDLSILGFVGSNILAIDERDRKNAIKPLKITAIIALCYDIVYSLFAILSDSGRNMDPRTVSLAGFAGLVWIITWIIAASLSRGARKKAERDATATLVASAVEAQKGGSDKQPEESEEEMRKRLEEKVRKEMEMEKEIRAKMESEEKQKEE